MTSRPPAFSGEARQRSQGTILIWVLVLIGLLARLSPLLDYHGRLSWQFMTEDGYLMQTVARNIAIGLGMSTAQGTIPTNGVQPLATLLFAAMHYLAGGDKLLGTALVTVCSTVVAAVAALFLYRAAARVFAPIGNGRELALLAAALWLAAPRILEHSMNGLETGLYYLAIAATLDYYLGLSARGTALGWGERLLLGVMLGITFLARNDAVFFIAALLLAHWLLGVKADADGADGNAGGSARRFADCVVAGVVSLVIASPWLWNNHTRFGSIVPISGQAESVDIHFGQNLIRVPSNLLEAAYLFAPVSRAMESSAAVALVSLVLVLAALAGFWFFVASRALTARRFFAAGVIFTLAIGLYYGLFFGAPHFVKRYTSALSLFLWPCTVAACYGLANLIWSGERPVRRAAQVVTVLLAVESAAFAALHYAHGRQHEHKQVIAWVEKNVPDDQWVGAVQTGTLSYFHDRTINLDGKVNPRALQAIKQEGNVFNYVLGSKINYLADWAAIAGWAQRKESPQFRQQFEIVVNDEQANLGVLRRINPVPVQ
jgi:hypothetical protein